VSLFATLTLEQEYASLKNFGELFPDWLRLVGIVSMVFLSIIALVHIAQVIVRGRGRVLLDGPTNKLANVPPEEGWKVRPYLLSLIVLAVSGIAAVVLWLVGRGVSIPVAASPQKVTEALQDQSKWYGYALMAFNIASGAALIALSWELLVDLFQTSPRRVWAIARLSIKEAIHRKALWSFVVLLAVFLFASWFIQAPRPEDQWRTYISLVFFVMTALILVTASTLACFSIPTDIKLQTIHTVVTKPVYKFELVLGRILGFSLLMTVVLLIVGHLSLLYVFRGIPRDEDRAEVMRARITHSGNLHFEELNEAGNWVRKQKSIMVGREWDYRQYIAGGGANAAVWTFTDLPASLQEMDRIPVEFGFDIFRTTKGGEDYKEGVSCQFTFINRQKWDDENYAAYRKSVEAEARVRVGERERAEQFGYYELPSPITIVDYKNFTVTFPGSLLKDAKELVIRVNCRTPSQYLGMAKHDLYLVAGDASFYVNFLKATSGIWFVMVVMVTLGVVFSTYLNALVSLLLTWMLMLCGLPRLRDYVLMLASANPEENPGGGPGESMLRIFKHENLTTPLEENMLKKLVAGGSNWFSFDDAARLFFKGFHDILPNLGQYDRIAFVAEGFNIPGSELVMSFLLMLGYLFPFLVAGYYFLNSREVAQ
jgi:ABC-type transport system involved in multi-copper enzyme maturation permease subunit